MKRKIPEEELPNPKLVARMMRDAVMPAELHDAVVDAMNSGRHPGTLVFHEDRRSAYKDPALSARLIREMAVYKDDQILRGWPKPAWVTPRRDRKYSKAKSATGSSGGRNRAAEGNSADASSGNQKKGGSE